MIFDDYDLKFNPIYGVNTYLDQSRQTHRHPGATIKSQKILNFINQRRTQDFFLRGKFQAGGKF